MLGISFNTYDDTIDESEIFEMSGLDNYRILNELLTINLAQQQRFFAEEQLKGNLPASYFAQIATQDLIGKITEMQAALSHYLASESRILSVNREVELERQTLTLNGNIANLYQNEVVLWRVGHLRDKDKIQTWIYHLLLCAYFPEKTVKFYYREGEQVGVLSFETVSQIEALSQLSIYLNAYLDGLSQAQLVIYDRIEEYLKGDGTNSEQVLIDLAEKDERDGSYLHRLLAQTKELDSQAIHQRTQSWFSLMNQKIAKGD